MNRRIQEPEVAKGAKEMVITDDGFALNISVVKKGRVIYAGIEKSSLLFTTFTLGNTTTLQSTQIAKDEHRGNGNSRP